MIKKWLSFLFGVGFLFIGLSSLSNYHSYGWIGPFKGQKIYDDSAYIVISIYVWLGVLSLISAFRDYKAIRRLGFEALKSEDTLNPNEAFRKHFEGFTLTIYSWRDTTFYNHQVNYGYRGLYLVLDYEKERPEEVDLLKDLFDKVDEEENAVIFFKEGWNVDEEDVPRLIRKVYKRLGISHNFGFNLLNNLKAPERHYRNTKLDFGRHLDNRKLKNYVESAFKVLPIVVLVVFINIFVKDEFSKILGFDSVIMNDLIASFFTIFIGFGQLFKAKYWSLDKGISKEKLFHTIKEEKMYSIIGIIFILFGVFKLLYLAAIN